MNKLDRIFFLIQKHFIAGIFLFIFLMVVLQVLFRYVLEFSAPWTEEFARVGMFYLTFFGAALGIRSKEHPAVDIFIKKMPVRLRHIVILLTNIMILVMGIIMVVYGFKYVKMTSADTSTSYRYPKSVFYLPIPLSGFIIIIYSFAYIYLCIKSIVTGENFEMGDEPR